MPGDVQWFPAEIRRLIVSIKKQEGLYNPKHENFGLREFHSKAWKQVATEVGGGKTGKHHLSAVEVSFLSVGLFPNACSTAALTKQ